ncbi:hypothetical protein J4464_04125 [Candidatus Woesearchaeota archaeon]|nr:hypothetical protein [Candidatus Woesearchaeota archaeon]
MRIVSDVANEEDLRSEDNPRSEQDEEDMRKIEHFRDAKHRSFHNECKPNKQCPKKRVYRVPSRKVCGLLLKQGLSHLGDIPSHGLDFVCCVSHG